MNIRFEGLRALVTGSTRGIGRAIAAKLLASGAAVVVHGRRQDDAEGVAEALRQEFAGAEVSAAHGDLSTREGCDTLIGACLDVDILVHNAGIYEWSPFFDTEDAQWLNLLQTNLLSGARLARHHLRRMLDRGWGRIVFIASDAGMNIPGDMIHYGVSKAAELALMRGLAELTVGSAVTVNAVLPGPTRTGAESSFFDDYATRTGVPRAQAERHFMRDARPTSLLQRMASADEVAAMVIYASSRQASATNGAALRAEGGILRHVG
jgi:NAD(P)-dependent dehydrogenase (short-subunit alcohol dehydrogenase family)